MRTNKNEIRHFVAKKKKVNLPTGGIGPIGPIGPMGPIGPAATGPGPGGRGGIFGAPGGTYGGILVAGICPPLK